MIGNFVRRRAARVVPENFIDPVAAELVGVVCHEHVGPPREWTTEARDFAGSVADLLAVRIQSARVNELKAAIAAGTYTVDSRRLASKLITSLGI